jgi:Domain of unknown function (DUF1844)
MSEDDKGFEVTDKRTARQALDDEANAAPQAAKTEDPGKGKPVSEGGSQAGSEKAQDNNEAKGQDRSLPPLDFLSFVGSLAATALMLMGERLSADMPEAEPDLPAAKQMIDLIDLLKAKTKGNLAGHEAEGLESILYNLRMRYIQLSKGDKAG